MKSKVTAPLPSHCSCKHLLGIAYGVGTFSVLMDKIFTTKLHIFFLDHALYKGIDFFSSVTCLSTLKEVHKLGLV